MTDLPHDPRFVERRLIEALADTPVVLIHGPRQCGKRTLALVVGEREGYISGDIKWRDVESLLKSLGAEVGERSGSRVPVFLHGRTALIYRPHPSPSLDKGAVRDIRRFLESTGVKP
jgi:hypothetical protein